MSPERCPGLYVHVPFCSAICPYCDFAVTRGTDARIDRFVSKLEAEIALLAPTGRHDTLYVGGGTPSLLRAAAISRLRDLLDRAGWLSSECHTFVEANPEDVSVFRALAEEGIHTLSLGIQALDDETLGFLGRRHSAKEARESVAIAREAGFPTVSADLIYGVPGQTVSSWRQTLESVVSLGVDHLSCYQLTIHPNTMFARRSVEAPPDDVQGELFRTTHRVLQDCGFEGYEVSNFAREATNRSLHNEKYWHHVPYRGLGPSAHSFDGRCRYWNERSFFDWERRVSRGEVPVAGRERLSDEDLALETLMLRLRTRDGLDGLAYHERFGVDVIARAERAVAEGLLRESGGWLRPTLDGMAVADALAVSLHG